MSQHPRPVASSGISSPLEARPVNSTSGEQRHADLSPRKSSSDRPRVNDTPDDSEHGKDGEARTAAVVERLTDTVAQQRTRIRELVLAAEQKDAAARELKALFERLTADYEVASRTAQADATALASLRAHASAVEEELERTQATALMQKEKIQHFNDEWAAKTDHLRQQFAMVVEEKSAAEQQRDELLEGHRVLRRETERLHRELEELRQGFDARLAKGIEEARSALKQEYKAQEAQLQEREEEVARERRRIDEGMYRISQENTASRESRDILQWKLSEMEKVVRGKEQLHQQLTTSLATLREQYTQSERAASAARDVHDKHLRDATESFQAQLRELHRLHDALQQEKARCEKAARAEREKLEQQLAEAQDRHRRALDECERQAQEGRRAVHALHEALDETKAKLTAAETRAHRAARLAEELTAHQTQAQEVEQTLRQSLTAADKQVIGLRSRVELLLHHLAEKEKETEAYRCTLERGAWVRALEWSERAGKALLTSGTAEDDALAQRQRTSQAPVVPLAIKPPTAARRTRRLTTNAASDAGDGRDGVDDDRTGTETTPHPRARHARVEHSESPNGGISVLSIHRGTGTENMDSSLSSSDRDSVFFDDELLRRCAGREASGVQSSHARHREPSPRPLHHDPRRQSPAADRRASEPHPRDATTATTPRHQRTSDAESANRGRRSGGREGLRVASPFRSAHHQPPQQGGTPAHVRATPLAHRTASPFTQGVDTAAGQLYRAPSPASLTHPLNIGVAGASPLAPSPSAPPIPWSPVAPSAVSSARAEDTACVTTAPPLPGHRAAVQPADAASGAAPADRHNHRPHGRAVPPPASQLPPRPRETPSAAWWERPRSETDASVGSARYYTHGDEDDDDGSDDELHTAVTASTGGGSASSHGRRTGASRLYTDPQALIRATIEAVLRQTQPSIPPPLPPPLPSSSQAASQTHAAGPVDGALAPPAGRLFLSTTNTSLATSDMPHRPTESAQPPSLVSGFVPPPRLTTAPEAHSPARPRGDDDISEVGAAPSLPSARHARAPSSTRSDTPLSDALQAHDTLHTDSATLDRVDAALAPVQAMVHTMDVARKAAEKHVQSTLNALVERQRRLLSAVMADEDGGSPSPQTMSDDPRAGSPQPATASRPDAASSTTRLSSLDTHDANEALFALYEPNPMNAATALSTHTVSSSSRHHRHPHRHGSRHAPDDQPAPATGPPRATASVAHRTHPTALVRPSTPPSDPARRGGAAQQDDGEVSPLTVNALQQHFRETFKLPIP